MRIELLFFAQVREALGRDAETIEVADGETAGGLLESLRRSSEWGALADLPLSLAVNEETVTDDYLLHNGDRVAFLPPVSGG